MSLLWDRKRGEAGNRDITDRRQHTRANSETGVDVYQATGEGSYARQRVRASGGRAMRTAYLKSDNLVGAQGTGQGWGKIRDQKGEFTATSPPLTASSLTE